MFIDNFTIKLNSEISIATHIFSVRLFTYIVVKDGI